MQGFFDQTLHIGQGTTFNSERVPQSREKWGTDCTKILKLGYSYFVPNIFISLRSRKTAASICNATPLHITYVLISANEVAHPLISVRIFFEDERSRCSALGQRTHFVS